MLVQLKIKQSMLNYLCFFFREIPQDLQFLSEKIPVYAEA